MKRIKSGKSPSSFSSANITTPDTELRSTDVAVPITRLPDIIEESKAALSDLGLFASILGHVGDGNFHCTIFQPPNPEARAKVQKMVDDMVDSAIEMEGTCTGEHGVGLVKKKALVNEVGEDAVDVMRALKRSLDPLWIMNPGKVFDP